MFANAFVMSNSAAGAISVRPEAAGTASGAMGFLQMGIGALVSQFGAWLGGHFATPVPLNIAIGVLSIACASTMIFLVPRRSVVVSEELIEQAEEEARESRRSSTQPLLGSITTATETLDHPLSRVMTVVGVSRNTISNSPPRHCEPPGRREAPPDERLREAIHRFAAPAMTLFKFQIQLRILAACFARGLACWFRPLQSEGAGNAGRPMRPIATCAMIVVEAHTR
jgi:hypothetical protein